MNLTVRILIGMAAGVVLGLLIQSGGFAPEHWVRAGIVDGVLDAGGSIFIRSLQLMVVPLVLVSLICGASSLGDSARMGPIAIKTLAWGDKAYSTNFERTMAAYRYQGTQWNRLPAESFERDKEWEDMDFKLRSLYQQLFNTRVMDRFQVPSEEVEEVIN